MAYLPATQCTRPESSSRASNVGKGPGTHLEVYHVKQLLWDMTFFVYVSFGTVLESFRNGSETPEISKPFPDRFKTVLEPDRNSHRMDSEPFPDSSATKKHSSCPPLTVISDTTSASEGHEAGWPV